jgi:hypothetical protein
MFAIPKAKKTSKPNLSIYIYDTSTIKLNQAEEAKALFVKRLNTYGSAETGTMRNWESAETGKGRLRIN